MWYRHMWEKLPIYINNFQKAERERKKRVWLGEEAQETQQRQGWVVLKMEPQQSEGPKGKGAC